MNFLTFMIYYLLALPFLIPTHSETAVEAQQATEQVQHNDTSEKTIEQSPQDPMFAANQQEQEEQDSTPFYRNKTPEEIQEQLKAAQANYEHALKLFNPWYTGPLITPSATMVPPGYFMWQPYIYFTDTYANYDVHRHVVDRPNLFTLKLQPVILQVGLTDSVDTTLIMNGVANWSKGKSGGGFNDVLLSVGFLVQKQSLYVPKFKFSITQSFPTGKYQYLSTDGLALDGTGAGAWQTTFTLSMGKVLFWNTLHPMNTRFAFSGTLSTSVHVRSFNVYGGGFKTNGAVHPGNSYSADLGLEISITQPWVAALDIVYNWSNKTPFHGKPGFNANGTPASVGTGYSDQLSLAPAIEYNFNENIGILWGVWFTVYGRNAPDFASGIFTMYWFF
jgi:hypothetical protein